MCVISLEHLSHFVLQGAAQGARPCNQCTQIIYRGSQAIYGRKNLKGMVLMREMGESVNQADLYHPLLIAVSLQPLPTGVMAVL